MTRTFAEKIAARNGLVIASWPLRLPVIRSIRAMAFCYRVNAHYDAWRSITGMGGWSKDEIEWWKAIKRGEA